MGTFYDENSPAGPVPADSEAGRVIGMSAALTRAPMPGGQNWLPGYYTPNQGKAVWAARFASSPATAFFTHEPPVKFADESMSPNTVTFAPVPGMEGHVGDMQSGYNPFQAKEPKLRASDHTPTNVLADRLAGQGAVSIGSSDNAILAILMDA